METKQTAVESLIQQQQNLLNDLKFGAIEIDEYEYFLSLSFEQAKQMEKEQIKDAFTDGCIGELYELNAYYTSEKYYEETYGTKKQDREA
jgi:hypothetical protein